MLTGQRASLLLRTSIVSQLITTTLGGKRHPKTQNYCYAPHSRVLLTSLSSLIKHVGNNKTQDKDSQYCSPCSKTPGEKLKPTYEEIIRLNFWLLVFQIQTCMLCLFLCLQEKEFYLRQIRDSCHTVTTMQRAVCSSYSVTMALGSDLTFTCMFSSPGRFPGRDEGCTVCPAIC